MSDPLEFEPTSQTLAAALAALAELGARGGGAVDATVRHAALQRYATLPRERRPSGRWRYDYAALSFDDLLWSSGRVPAPLAARGAQAQPRAADAVAPDAPSLALDNAGGLVHVGSLFLESPAPASERGFTLACLADAKRALPERVAAIHQRLVVPSTDRIAALSTAFQNCGAYVEVPEGVRLEAPLQLVWTARPGKANAVFPHTVVRIGAGARATLVERHVGAGESFVAGSVEVDLAAGARLDYVVVQQTDEGTRLLFRRRARCAAGASIGWHLAEHGGGLVRSVVQTALLGRRAQADVNALFFARGFEHVDLALHIDHAGAETESRAVVRGASFDRAQGRFDGGLRLRPEARRSNALLAFDALSLSPRASLAAVSPLEVAASGASARNTAEVGSLAAEALFYVQSRGISRRDAEHMMALAFFEPALGRFPSEALRDEMRAVLDAQLDDIPETFKV